MKYVFLVVLVTGSPLVAKWYYSYNWSGSCSFLGDWALNVSQCVQTLFGRLLEGYQTNSRKISWMTALRSQVEIKCRFSRLWPQKEPLLVSIRPEGLILPKFPSFALLSHLYRQQSDVILLTDILFTIYIKVYI